MATVPTVVTPELAAARASVDHGGTVAQLWRARPPRRRAAWQAELARDVARLRDDATAATVIDTLALCAHDRRNRGASRCARCGDAFCDDCVVRPLGADREAYCVTCAVDVTQRTRRSNPRFHQR